MLMAEQLVIAVFFVFFSCKIIVGMGEMMYYFESLSVNFEKNLVEVFDF